MTHYRLFRRRRILGLNDQSYLDRWPLALTPWGRVYLHRFHAPDPACLHDHPWRFWSLVLWGGYWETTKTGTTYRGIGSLAYRPATWTHRVARLHPRRTTWDVGRHRADGADVGLLHTVGLGRILANRPQGRVLRQCRIARASQIVQRLGVVRGTSG